MVATFRRAGLSPLPPAGGFAPPTGRVLGNQLPPDTGKWPSTYVSEQDAPGPHPASQPMGGTSGGGNDGFFGPDPRSPQMSPNRWSTWVGAWGEGDPGSAPGTSPATAGYAAGAPEDGNASRLGRTWYSPTAHGRASYWRGGIQGFNDKLTVKDRHVYWDTGHQRQGTNFTPASSPPNTYNNPIQEPPRADLRAVNRTISYQKGTDTSRFQDDLSRPYTWVGEQGSGWTPVYGGVVGLYEPYGTRGGVPLPIVDPTNGQGGREAVWSGPPHGLHSLTYPDVGDTLNRYLVNVQMRPVRLDRPSNSPIAGQAYSQTVEYQGSTQGAAQAGTPATSHPGPRPGTSRGWSGAQRPDERRR